MQVFDPDGITETIDTAQGGGRGPYTMVPIQFSRMGGVMGEIDTANALNASDWRGLNRNQTQNAVAIKIIGNTRLYDGKAKNDKDRIFAVDGIGGR